MTHHQRKLIITVATAALGALCALGASTNVRAANAPPDRAHGAATTRRDSVQATIASLLAGSPTIDGYAAHRWHHVRQLYETRGDSAAWRTGGAWAARASALLDALADAPAQALRVDDYPMRALLAALNVARAPNASAAAVARADIALTSAFVAYAEDLLTGQVDPRTVSHEWHIDPQDDDVAAAMRRTLAARPFAPALDALRPHDDDYAGLTDALARYRSLVQAGGWQPVHAAGTLHPGDTATTGTIASLRARLDLSADTSTSRYDAALAGAVAAYQRSHGLVTDSVVGPNTLASLNTPAEYRLRQIAANLERHRWLPRRLGSRYIIVNVPAFRLQAVDGGEPVLSMKVVVGAEYGGRSTPVFSDSMEYIVFRPYWNVPRGIAARELWPRQRRDPGYFASHGYETARANGGTYVRQKPGPGNALGFVKFIFPNDFSIYLHDTPSRQLFNQDVRAFSHGCIRVEQPAELARYVLGWDLDRVNAAMDDGPNDQRVNLAHKLPVYIVYFTTYLRAGSLQFANDIYDRDDALVRQMRGAALPDSVATAEAAALHRFAASIRGVD